jgi:hypothetical protein
MNPNEGLSAVANAAQAVIAVHDGRPIDAARHAIAAALDLVPKDVAEKLLTEEAIRRANAIADLMERAKFG